jgi:hypothetical protein
MCPAGPRVRGFRPHFTITYVEDEKLKAVVGRHVRKYTIRHVLKSGTHRALPARPLKQWGENSFYIEGTLEDFKRGLHNHLVWTVGEKALGDYRRAHVNVRGNWERPVYRQFRLMDRIS